MNHFFFFHNLNTWFNKNLEKTLSFHALSVKAFQLKENFAKGENAEIRRHLHNYWVN